MQPRVVFISLKEDQFAYIFEPIIRENFNLKEEGAIKEALSSFFYYCWSRSRDFYTYIDLAKKLKAVEIEGVDREFTAIFIYQDTYYFGFSKEDMEGLL